MQSLRAKPLQLRIHCAVVKTQIILLKIGIFYCHTGEVWSTSDYITYVMLMKNAGYFTTTRYVFREQTRLVWIYKVLPEIYLFFVYLKKISVAGFHKQCPKVFQVVTIKLMVGTYLSSKCFFVVFLKPPPTAFTSSVE